jgi:hypothetical protein
LGRPCANQEGAVPGLFGITSCTGPADPSMNPDRQVFNAPRNADGRNILPGVAT